MGPSAPQLHWHVSCQHPWRDTHSCVCVCEEGRGREGEGGRGRERKRERGRKGGREREIGGWGGGLGVVRGTDTECAHLSSDLSWGSSDVAATPSLASTASSHSPGHKDEGVESPGNEMGRGKEAHKAAPSPTDKGRSARAAGKERRVPRDLLCPISHALMMDPVVAEDGFTYERQAIEQWFAHCR